MSTAWDRFKGSTGQQKRALWVEEGRRRAMNHTLTWLKDAHKAAKLMDDPDEVRILGMALLFKEKLERGERIDIHDGDATHFGTRFD